MTKSRILGAAAIVAAVITTPAMAQQAMQEPGAYAQAHPWATDYYYYRSGPSYYRYGPSGFWPGDVAAGVVGGAVGTAAAIVTAPIGSDAYGRQNGFVCTPGTWFRGEDGRRHLCQ